MFESLTDLVSGSPWTYAFLFAVSGLDVIIPLVPSETSVITAGVLAASGDLNIGLIILVAACGAVLGDNVAYGLGNLLEGFVRGRLFGGGRKRRLEQAERALVERGPYLIIIGRFIPGGRTAVTFACGLLRFRWRRFIVFDVAAGILWATYSGLVGYFGGKAFEDSPIKGILLALGIAFGIAAVVEFVRWRRRREVRQRMAGDSVDHG